MYAHSAHQPTFAVGGSRCGPAFLWWIWRNGDAEDATWQKRHFFWEFVHSWKLTCPLKINGWKMYSLLKQSLFRGHVSFPVCNPNFYFNFLRGRGNFSLQCLALNEFIVLVHFFFWVVVLNIFLILTLTWGRFHDFHFDSYFSNGLKPPTSFVFVPIF